MVEPRAASDAGVPGGDEVSLLALGTLLLRWRRAVVGLAIAGLAIGAVAGLVARRRYVASATIVPQGSEGMESSGLALAASQFGIRLPTSGNAWGPPVYVELLGSPSLLAPLAADTVEVVEQGGRRVALVDLLEVRAASPTLRLERTVRALRRVVAASEDKRLAAVRLTVTTRWPSVSLALAERLMSGLNQFNLETRRSQATAERQFVEARADEAERSLREAENRLEQFLLRNRAIADAPELVSARDRLQREMMLRQQVYTSLVQSREEARIREVRDTPVYTVLEGPRLPVIPRPRRVALKGLLGAIAGALLGALVAVGAQQMAEVRRASDEEAKEFRHLWREAMPRILRRGPPA